MKDKFFMWMITFLVPLLISFSAYADSINVYLCIDISKSIDLYRTSSEILAPTLSQIDNSLGTNTNLLILLFDKDVIATNTTIEEIRENQNQLFDFLRNIYSNGNVERLRNLGFQIPETLAENHLDGSNLKKMLSTLFTLIKKDGENLIIISSDGIHDDNGDLKLDEDIKNKVRNIKSTGSSEQNQRIFFLMSYGQKNEYRNINYPKSCEFWKDVFSGEDRLGILYFPDTIDFSLMSTIIQNLQKGLPDENNDVRIEIQNTLIKDYREIQIPVKIISMLDETKEAKLKLEIPGFSDSPFTQEVTVEKGNKEVWLSLPLEKICGTDTDYLKVKVSLESRKDSPQIIYYSVPYDLKKPKGIEFNSDIPSTIWLRNSTNEDKKITKEITFFNDDNFRGKIKGYVSGTRRISSVSLPEDFTLQDRDKMSIKCDFKVKTNQTNWDNFILTFITENSPEKWHPHNIKKNKNQDNISNNKVSVTIKMVKSQDLGITIIFILFAFSLFLVNTISYWREYRNKPPFKIKYIPITYRDNVRKCSYFISIGIFLIPLLLSPSLIKIFEFPKTAFYSPIVFVSLLGTALVLFLLDIIIEKYKKISLIIKSLGFGFKMVFYFFFLHTSSIITFGEKCIIWEAYLFICVIFIIGVFIKRR